MELINNLGKVIDETERNQDKNYFRVLIKSLSCLG